MSASAPTPSDCPPSIQWSSDPPTSLWISVADDEWSFYEKYLMGHRGRGDHAGRAVGPGLTQGARLDSLHRLPPAPQSPRTMAPRQTPLGVPRRDRRYAPRGVVQCRPDGGARRVAGQEPSTRHRLRARPAAAPPARQRACPGRQLQPVDHRRGRGAAHCASGRGAAGQLSPARGADADRQAAPAAWLQQGASEAPGRPLRGATAGLRHRHGSHRPQRRPSGLRQPESLRDRLSAPHHPDAGRTVGHPHHASPGADREPAPGSRSSRRSTERTPTGRGLG